MSLRRALKTAKRPNKAVFELAAMKLANKRPRHIRFMSALFDTPHGLLMLEWIGNMWLLRWLPKPVRL